MIVQLGDEMGDLRGRCAVGQHALNQLADFAAQADQGFQPWSMANGTCQMHQVDPLQRKQVTLGNNPTQALIFNQAHVGNMPLRHGDCSVESAVIGAQVERPGGHVQVDGLVEILNAIGNDLTQVAQGENPQRSLNSSTTTMLPTCCSCIRRTASRSAT